MAAGDSESIVTISAIGEKSVAAREITGPVHVGDLIFQQREQPSPADVTAPPGTNNLPHPASCRFIGRDRELETLRAAVETSGSAVVAQTLEGLGGVGKTTLAVEYAHARKECYEVIWWISAERPESIASGLASLALRLKNLRGVSRETGTADAEWAVSWLQSHTDWLLILDNAESPEVIASIIGQAGDGHYLITSRISVGWGSIAQQIKLNVLSLGDSVDLITQITGVAGELEWKNQLAVELGFLPLAIEQAASYIAYTQSSCQRYFQLLRSVPVKALSATAGVDTGATTVARTWHVTLQSIEARNPVAIRILKHLAWVGSVDFPREAVYSFSQHDTFDTDDALGLLAAYSMVSLTSESVSVHRLVQSVIRTSEEGADSSEYHYGAAAGIIDSLDREPEANYKSWPMWQKMMPHVETLDDLVPEAEVTAPLHELLCCAARFLQSQNQLEQAFNYAEKCVRIAESEIASDGVDVLACRNIYGGVLQNLGRNSEAEAFFADLLQDSISKLGPLDPFTLSQKNNLASSYQQNGRVAEAIVLFAETLADREKVLPAEHPSILTSRHNLASAYGIDGQIHRAIPLLESVAKERAKTLGESSFSALNSMSVLADAYEKIGNISKAARLIKFVFGRKEEALGADSTGVLRARQKLADLYRAAGNAKRAAPLYEENLSVAERFYGVDDDRTVDCVLALAFAYQDLRQIRQAIRLLQRVLEHLEMQRAEDGVYVALALNNLAVAHWAAGEMEVSKGLLRRALSELENCPQGYDEARRSIETNYGNVLKRRPVMGARQFQVGGRLR
ncbi:FxSxx-COOH system tetratricopeptide repeat protein [Streptomyces sp. NPDC056910]|uniref:FxSxx-COOH system tetratricopeptide repeat protein n=1 Tax=Streptomyces sp. NPDC056910 TaxID=3345964 RepID=UPI0036963982